MLTGHQNATLIVNSVFPVLALLVTALRLYARRIKRLSLTGDDYAILAASVFMLGNSMPFIYGATNGGMGAHLEDLSNNQLVIFGKVTFWTQFPYIFSVSLIKLSILLLYSKIFATPKFHMVVRIMEAIIILWTIAFFFASLFQAYPIDLNWNPELPGHEINELDMYLALASTELILDVATLTLPWTVIWRLQMKTGRKWAVSGVFTLGGLVCISSAFRIFYFQASHTGASKDFTYETYNIFIWTAIEPCLGIICASLPVLGPLFTSRPGASTESMLGSIRSYLRLRSWSSRNASSRSRSNQAILPISSNSASKTKDHVFHALPDDAIILTDVQGTKHDWDMGKGSEGIIVSREFISAEG